MLTLFCKVLFISRKALWRCTSSRDEYIAPPPWHYYSSSVESPETHHGWISGTWNRHLPGPFLNSGTTFGVLIVWRTCSKSISLKSFWQYMKVTSRKPGIGTGCIFWIRSLVPEVVTLAGNTIPSVVQRMWLFLFRLSLLNARTGSGIGGLTGELLPLVQEGLPLVQGELPLVEDHPGAHQLHRKL